MELALSEGPLLVCRLRHDYDTSDFMGAFVETDCNLFDRYFRHDLAGGQLMDCYPNELPAPRFLHSKPFRTAECTALLAVD